MVAFGPAVQGKRPSEARDGGPPQRGEVQHHQLPAGGEGREHQQHPGPHQTPADHTGRGGVRPPPREMFVFVDSELPSKGILKFLC